MKISFWPAISNYSAFSAQERDIIMNSHQIPLYEHLSFLFLLYIYIAFSVWNLPLSKGGSAQGQGTNLVLFRSSKEDLNGTQVTFVQGLGGEGLSFLSYLMFQSDGYQSPKGWWWSIDMLVYCVVWWNNASCPAWKRQANKYSVYKSDAGSLEGRSFCRIQVQMN